MRRVRSAHLRPDEPSSTEEGLKSQPHRAPARPTNRLLASLPDDDFRRLRPALHTVPLRLRQLLHKQHEPVRYVYFPNHGLASVTTMMSDGALLEVALVGNEGMLGIEALFTDEPVATGERMMQVVSPTCDAERLAVEDFRREYARRGTFHDMVGCYAQATLVEIVQTAACNALHSVRERCARWLLMALDRMQRREFDVSHDFLALMLAVTRPTVTEAAGLLQDQGLIRYTHGHLTVLDRNGLEHAACECYAAIRAAFENFTTRYSTVS